MPVVSQAQAGFVAMSKTPEGRAKLRAHGKEPMPVKVAKEYQKATKGTQVSKLPKRAKHQDKTHSATSGS
jgi:hypothetical protein